LGYGQAATGELDIAIKLKAAIAKITATIILFMMSPKNIRFQVADSTYFLT
jgi:hypothetical protein